MQDEVRKQSNIFEKGQYLDPKYQHLDKYVLMMYRSFWTPAKYEKLIKEQDVPYYFNEMGEIDQEAIKRCILAVAMVEDKVKIFWPTLYSDFPQTVIGDVGGVFGMSEIAHRRSYHALLENLRIDPNEINHRQETKGRIDYLTKYLEVDPKIIGKKRVLKKLVLFTALIERISLFTQFYILMSYAKRNRGLKIISSLQQSTAQEECYIAGTEVFTPMGWRDILDVREGDEIIQWNNGVSEIVKVTNVTQRHFAGELIKFHKTSHQCVVTPNHNMVTFSSDGRRVEELAKDLKLHCQRFIPESFNNDLSSGEKLTTLERIFVAIQADGSKLIWKNAEGVKLNRGKGGGFNYQITVTKQRKIERIRMLLEASGLRFDESISDKGRGKPYHTFKMHIETDLDLKSFDWVDLGKVSPSWAHDFCSELIHWDGSIENCKNRKFCYASTNKSCIDKAQCLGMLAGYRTQIYKRVDPRKESYKNCYKIGFSESTGFKRAHSLKREYIPYEGMVGCVSVPSGVIATRYNNETFIGGNCTHYACGIDIINIIKQESPQLWDDYLVELIEKNIKEAYKAEKKLIKWFFEKGVPSHLSEFEVENFLNHNFNEVCRDLGLSMKYPVCQKTYEEKNKWMMEKITTTCEPDFFDMPSGNYASEEEEIDLDNFEF